MSADPGAALRDAAARVRGVVLDVDGVLTDGRIIYSDDGRELKAFHVRDGASIKLLAAQGLAVGIITGRSSAVVARRARELGVTHVVQGAADKQAALAELIDGGFPAADLCAVGDDLPDLALFEDDRVILAATVADAHPAVRARAAFVTAGRGGEGVVAELAELLLTAQGKWDLT